MVQQPGDFNVIASYKGACSSLFHKTKRSSVFNEITFLIFVVQKFFKSPTVVKSWGNNVHEQT